MTMLAWNVVQRTLDFRTAPRPVLSSRQPGRRLHGGSDRGPASVAGHEQGPDRRLFHRVEDRSRQRSRHLGRFAVAIGDAGGNIAGIGFEAKGPSVSRTGRHSRSRRGSRSQTRRGGQHLAGGQWSNGGTTLRIHEGGKIECCRCAASPTPTTSPWRTPWSACGTAIHDDIARAHDYTSEEHRRHRSDGTAVLGLGDIGPEAAMQMEGKALLFKESPALTVS